MIKLTTDRLKVWRNVNENGNVSWSYSISTKKQDGTYDYMSKRIRFMKDKEPNDSCDIMINNSFLSFYEVDGNKYDYLMVLDYDIINGNDSITTDEVTLTDDDLPF